MSFRRLIGSAAFAFALLAGPGFATAAEIVDFGITVGKRTEGEATAGQNALVPLTR